MNSRWPCNKCYHRAAVWLAQKYKSHNHLPDRFSRGLNLHLIGDAEDYLLALANRHKELSGTRVNWLGNFEEIYWRATVLPRLQARNSALVSSLIVGIIQGLWHLPYLFINGHYVQSIGFPAIILQSIAMGIVATWLYNNTRGSLLIVALFHAAYDAMSPFQGTDINLLYLSIGVCCFAALLIVILFGARHFSRKPDSELAYAIISPDN